MITVNIHKMNEKKRAPTYWKLNSNIFENKDYENKMSFFFWQKWQQRKEKYQDINAWWDNRKNIQGLTKDFCTDLK